MSQNRSDTTSGIFAVFAILFTVAFLYGMFWVFKTVSYQIFYEDMVIETVQEMVKPESPNPSE